MALYNPRCIIYKLLDIQKQKKEVLLKQAVQRISGKKNEEGKKKSLKQFVFRMKSLLPRHTRRSWKTNVFWAVGKNKTIQSAHKEGK